MANEVTKLAYEEARAALREQDASLSNVRNRATAVLSAAAVGTTFATAVGLLNTDAKKGPVFPSWAAWGLLAAIVVIAASVLIALWPTPKWSFGPNATKILASSDSSADEVLNVATIAMVAAATSNNHIINRCFWAYRVSAIVLMTEIGFLVIALIIGI